MTTAIIIICLVLGVGNAVWHYLLLEKDHCNGMVAFIPFYGTYKFFSVVAAPATSTEIVSYMLVKVACVVSVCYSLYLMLKMVVYSFASLFKYMLAKVQDYNNDTPMQRAAIEELMSVFIGCLIIGVITLIITFFVQADFAHKVALRYYKRAGFALGLTLLPIVFYGILAMSKAYPDEGDQNENS